MSSNNKYEKNIKEKGEKQLKLKIINNIENEQKEIIDEKLIEEKKKKMLSIKKFIRELSIKLANIHINSKDFAKDKILSFAG